VPPYMLTDSTLVIGEEAEKKGTKA
jgi:hypothetical protein